MFTSPVRLFLIVLACFIGGLRLYDGHWTGFLYLAAAGLFAWAHYRYGTVRRAFQAMRSGDMRGAANLIARIRHPERLNLQNWSYFHMIKGVLLLTDGDLESARSHFDIAAEGGLRTGNDRSLVDCYLAEVCLGMGDRDDAREYLHRARTERHKPDVDEMIAAISRRLEAAP